jgi:cytochrome c peroxidase
MHDGSLTSLKDVIDYYARGGDYSPNKSELIKQLDLSDEEKRDLVSFLESLTGDTDSKGRGADKYAAESFE